MFRKRRFVFPLVAVLVAVPIILFAEPVGLPHGPGASKGPKAPARPQRPLSLRPPLWELQPALRPPQEIDNPNAPVVDVSREAQLNPRGVGDLDPTIDVQITQEILDKAAELGSVQAMYEFVRNECQFQPYYGSRKGSVETLRQLAGNDYDLASLLIALLRASDIPARYAAGLVEMPTARVNSWLGVEDEWVAGSILFTNGMEGTVIVSGPNVVAVRARRVWVEAFVPRGFGSPVWIPLDPAFQLHSVDTSVLDIPEEMGLNAIDFIDDYYNPADAGVTLPRTQTPLEVFKEVLTDYLDTNHPGLTLDDVRRAKEIIPETLGILPSSLPYTVRTRDSVFHEIPANRRYQVRLEMLSASLSTLINYTADLPTIAGKRVTIDYVGATQADVDLIEANGGLFETPPSSVSLKPVLRIDGQQVAVGASGVGMGLLHYSDIHFLAPVNSQGLPQNVVPAIYNTNISGASQAIALGIEGSADRLLLPPPAGDTEGTLSLNYDTAVDYLSNVRNDELELGQLLHAFVTTDVTTAILHNVVKVTYNGFGVPQTFDWVGLLVDADRAIAGYWPVDRLDNPDQEPKDFLVIAGANGSSWENFVFERSFDQGSVSTMNILQFAADAGVTVYQRWNTLPLPPNTQPTAVRNALTNAINSGHEVTFPADPLTIGDVGTGQWTGTGWIDMDPDNGAAGYIISGNNNGGATYEVWPPEFIDLGEGDRDVTNVVIRIIDPDMDSPDSDSIFTRDNEQKLNFRYELDVSYSDGGTATLGPYTKTTQNSTKTFSPGNYTFHVWIARFAWFSFGLWHAERKVSIVGVLIREDDGTPLGKEAPKYLQIRPTSEDPCKKPLKAVVIPENAPGGGALATAHSWSGTSKVQFENPTAQIANIWPQGQDPSTALEDQEVNVDVTLPGGKMQKGYRKFTYAHGGEDEKYKPTVIKVEMVLHKPKVVDTAEPEIPEADKKTKGAQTFVNLDNDDGDGIYDTGATDSDVAGEDEMIKLKLRLKPSSINEGNVKLEASSGAAGIKAWKKENKNNEEYTLGTNIAVPGDFTVEGDALVATRWIEGVSAHTAQRETMLTLKYDKVDPCKDEAAVTMVGIDKIEWIGKNNSRNDNSTLDGDPNWPGGVNPGSVRVFPDARAPGGAVEANPRDRVDVKVTLTVAPIEAIDIHFDSFDTDDPTSAVAPIDNESGAEDNRGTAPARSGMFDGEAAGVKTQSFDAKEKTFEFQVTMHPGDNFRVVGNGDKDFLAELRNDDHTAGADNNDKQRIINRHITGTHVDKEVREANHYCSNVLTVWRFLHCEVDSMVAVPVPPNAGHNRIVTTLTDIRNGTTELVVAAALGDGSTQLPAGNGRFERGRVDIGTGAGLVTIDPITGNGADFVRHTGVIPLPFTIAGPAGPPPPPANATGNVVALAGNTFTVDATGGTPAAGHVGGTLTVAGVDMVITAIAAAGPPAARFSITVAAHAIPIEIRDDDNEAILPRSVDFSGVATPFGEAYILPLADGGTDPANNTQNVVFEQNEDVSAGGANINANMRQDTPAAAEQDRYWVAYISSALQFSRDSDDDPNLGGLGGGEGGTGGVVFGAVSNAAVARGGDATWVYLETCRDREAHDVPAAAAGLEARVCAHELGHQLGLGHMAGSLMNPSLQAIPANPNFNDTHKDLLRRRVRSPGQ